VSIDYTGSDTSGCVYRDGSPYNCDTVLGTRYYFAFTPGVGVPIGNVFNGGDWCNTANWRQINGVTPSLPDCFTNVTTSITATNRTISGPFLYYTSVNVINIDSFFTNCIIICASNLSYFGGNNRGTFYGPVQFGGVNYCNVFNTGSNYTLFSYSSKNCGTVTGLTRLENGAINYGTICGSVCTQNTPYNCGIIIGDVICSCQALYNYGSISGNVDFGSSSCNCGIVSGCVVKSAYFCNYGIITGNALFCYSSVNSGTVSGEATFCRNSKNFNSIKSGSFIQSINCASIYCCGYFVINSINYAPINNCAYFGSSCNYQTINGYASFTNSLNSGIINCTGCFYNSCNFENISGCGIFGNCSVNSGLISGDSYFFANSNNYGCLLGTALFAGATNYANTFYINGSEFITYICAINCGYNNQGSMFCCGSVNYGNPGYYTTCYYDSYDCYTGPFTAFASVTYCRSIYGGSGLSSSLFWNSVLTGYLCGTTQLSRCSCNFGKFNGSLFIMGDHSCNYGQVCSTVICFNNSLNQNGGMLSGKCIYFTQSSNYGLAIGCVYFCNYAFTANYGTVCGTGFFANLSCNVGTVIGCICTF
jgi:hypothetical protein